MEGQEAILYKCTACDVLFQTMHDVEQHICTPDEQYIGPDTPQMNIYKCSGCDGLYNDINVFNSHICNTEPAYNQQYHDISERDFSTSEAYQTSNEEHMIVDHTLQGQVVKEELLSPADERAQQQVHAQQQQILVDANSMTDADDNVQHVSVVSLLKQDETPEVTDYYNERVCPACGTECVDLKHLRQHKQSEHSIQRLVSCHTCNRFFSKQSLLSLHQRLFHSRRWSRTLSPAQTSISQLDEETINTSMKSFGVGEAHNSELFNCSECVATFSDQSYVREHEECIHGIHIAATFDCRHCDRSYSTRRELVKHERRRHHGGFLCDEAGCTKSFKTKLALEFHIRAHLGLKLDCMTRCFKCERCPRRFSQRRACRRHEQLHGQNPQICPWCRSAFISRQTYHKHCRQVHSGRVRCVYCAQKFLSSGQLSRHMKQRHGVREDDLPTDPSVQYPHTGHVRADTAFYYCTKCMDIFTSHRALLQHHSMARSKHSQTCTACGGITFVTQLDYERHQHSKHQHRTRQPAVDPRPRRLPVESGHAFNCSECGLNFRNKKGLGIHMGRAHGGTKQQPVQKMQEAPPPPPQLPQPDVGCMISVSQEGRPIPISTGNKEPYTRILKVQDDESQKDDDTMRSSRKKQLHYFIYELRNHIQDGLAIVLPNQAPPDKDRSYASYFEDILNLPPIQSCLSEMESVAVGCRVTFSLPFPHNLVAMVWVNFVMSFERSAAVQEET